MRNVISLALLLMTVTPLSAAGSVQSIPDIAVVDQNGKAVQFHRDLVKGKLVAMNFIFTSCTTVCTPMGANFAALQKLLGDRTDVALISVSIDPVNDTPARLKAWSARFQARPGWTLVTGAQRDVDRLVKALGVYSGSTFDHSPVAIIGNDASGRWTRVNGLVPAPKLVTMLDEHRTRAAEAKTNPTLNYFTDVQLVNQDGDTMRLYSDLISGKIVIINAFFTSCTGACPVAAGNMAAIQTHVGDRLGKDVVLISISVDPVTDTPAKLKEYAQRFKARPGWYFLGGKKENVDTALRKLGQYVDDPAAHQNLIIMGNEASGLWKKAFGLAKSAEILPVVDSVLNDPIHGKG